MRRASLSWQARAIMARWTACRRRSTIIRPTARISLVGVANPADDPNVTAVGGTNLQTTATPGVDDAAYYVKTPTSIHACPRSSRSGPTETVTVGNNTWGSGGGFSVYFHKPALPVPGQHREQCTPLGARCVLNDGRLSGRCGPRRAELPTLPRSAALVWIGGEPNRSSAPAHQLQRLPECSRSPWRWLAGVWATSIR